MPDAATIERTKAVMNQVSEMALKTPGVADVVEVVGYNVIDQIKQPFAGFAFVILKPWDQRKTPETRVQGIMAGMRAKTSEIPQAVVLIANAPPIPGLGATGGFKYEIQDLNDQGIEALSKAVENFIGEARKRPELTRVYTTFNPAVPQRYLDVDRTKAKTRKVSITDIFDTLQINLGSLYVNEFNKYGRVYRVYLQAEAEARSDEADITRLKVRNADGDMIALSAFIRTRPVFGPYNIPHYNMYKSIAVNGNNAPGYSSGQAIQTMEELAGKALPEGFGTEWTDVTYQQLKAGNLAPIIFGLSLVFVFLVLSAQYESWSMPIMVLLGCSLRAFRCSGGAPFAQSGPGRLRPDRPGDAHRPDRQKRYSDCGIRRRAAAAGCQRPGSGHEGGPNSVAADSDDGSCLYHRADPPGHSQRCRGQCPAFPGNHGCRGVDGCHNSDHLCTHFLLCH